MFRIGDIVMPYPFTPYLQASVAIAALLVGISALLASFSIWTSERNARLVEIGVGVLRADPKKEPTALAARKWALDLIDANAGGVRFSSEARQQLLTEPIGFDWDSYTFGPPTYDGSDIATPTPGKRSRTRKNSN
jgi:hypothetical protein